MSIFRRKPRTVRVLVANGIGWPLSTIELTEGAGSVLVDSFVTLNVCDRGLDSEDGKHRLKEQDIHIKLRLSLAQGASA